MPEMEGAGKGVRFPFLPLKRENRKEMKEKSEERTAAAVKLLLEVFDRNFEDSNIILEEFEETHDDEECFKSKEYQALVGANYALKQGIDRIIKHLNE